jgi:hypothetical protein
MPGEVLTPLEEDQIDRFLDRNVLSDKRFNAPRQLGIIEDADLHVEDGRFFGSGVLLRALSQVEQSFACARLSGVQAIDLCRNLSVIDDPVGNLWHLPSKQVDRPHDDPRGRGYPDEDRLHSAFSET